MTGDPKKTCGDCGVFPGELHQSGCDIEQCPRCGFQAISCNCIYEIFQIDPATMEEKHPNLYEHGPTEAMVKAWDVEWDHRRLRWTGEFPGAAECREFGWYSKFILTPEGPYMGRWEECGPDYPQASENINRLYAEASWDADKQRWVKR